MRLTEAAAARVLFALALFAFVPAAHAVGDLLGHGPSQPDQIDDPTPDLFSICFQHTCAQVAQLSLTAEQWTGVRGRFEPPPASAEEERERIASAIAYLEVEIGKQVDTLDDRGGNLEGFLATGNQMDCVDESTNSTTYLKMMEKDGLLHFHQVMPKATRARSRFFIIGWPHSTAVVRDRMTDETWAVDSWFLDNGEEPTIVPLSLWRTGWEPKT